MSVLNVIDVFALVFLEDFLVHLVRSAIVDDGDAASRMRGAACLLLLFPLLLMTGRSVRVALEIIFIEDRPLFTVFPIVVPVGHALEGIVLHTVLHSVAESPHTLAHLPHDDSHEACHNEEEESDKGEEESHRQWVFRGER